MALGLKNAGDIIPSVLNMTDFSVNEQCVDNTECPTFAAYIAAGEARLPHRVPGRRAAGCSRGCRGHLTANGTAGFSTVMKKMELDGWVQYCDGKASETRYSRRGKREVVSEGSACIPRTLSTASREEP